MKSYYWEKCDADDLERWENEGGRICISYMDQKRA